AVGDAQRALLAAHAAPEAGGRSVPDGEALDAQSGAAGPQDRDGGAAAAGVDDRGRRAGDADQAQRLGADGDALGVGPGAGEDRPARRRGLDGRAEGGEGGAAGGAYLDLVDQAVAVVVDTVDDLRRAGMDRAVGVAVIGRFD